MDTTSKSSPSDFVSGKTELRNPHGTGIYAITDDEFNDALGPVMDTPYSADLHHFRYIDATVTLGFS
ncbi:hypothetical protein [Brevibacterium sp. UCMA 11754]|uniref:hypothetical protein n=1 Tax=Brevibacterium sp. UCMA 11754 TaxID=2749198 RepID=UPI001F47B8B0|nr:hypothetical protein [Brevibacterium sp. UCMA 11754]MCF2573157.1 hypothetical protein [Brevibacterium sp. UCMA 11754]